ncbi:sensor histidine kinase, partial [Streptomyces anatolicus]|uniref:sensor histidine kinase n=1 Tax=Streptomyces anatolicus TaxID=2675858 RepID=UPI001CA56E86
ARGFAVKAVGLFRIAHLVYAADVVATGPSDWRSVGLLAAVGAVTLLLYGSALLRGWFHPRWVWADVLLTGCVFPWVAVAAIGDGPAVEPHGWLMVQALSSAAAAMVALGLRGAAWAVLLLLSTSLSVYEVVASPTLPALFDHFTAVVEAAALAGAGWWYLRRQGSRLDLAQERAVVAETARARQAERVAHHAALHDTVLATLTTIAAGRVDANAPAVRDRCAREAAYLRRLVQAYEEPPRHSGLPAPGGMSTWAALEEAARSAESLGLKVTAQYDAVPDLPREVAHALAAAVSEALNNVHKHARTPLAYLTVFGSTGGVEVVVADRGIGFDTSDRSHRRAGTGLRRSVHGRMAAIGGSAEVDSRPGEGTVVELRWPA